MLSGNFYVHRDGAIDGLDGMTESGWVAKQLGHPVIKAFNNIYFYSLVHRGQPVGSKSRIALPVAGDDAAHKATVMALIEQIGFDTVDAGGLDESWRQQPGSPVYCTDYDAAGVTAKLQRADRTRLHAVRALSVERVLTELEAGTPHNQVARISREVLEEQWGQ